MSRTQKPYIDYANLGDDGTDTTTSIQPPTYEPATPTNFGRPHQNIRSRTEIVRSALADLFYYADRSRYTLELAGSGQLQWETAGVGRANNTDTLTLRPFLGPRANVKGLLTIGTAGTNQLLYTVQATVYASDGINAVTVEHRHVAATVTPLATVTEGPIYRVLVVFDNTNVGHTATVVAPIVAAAIAGSTYLNGKIVVTADDAPGNAILGTTGEVAIDTRVHPAGTAGNATADLETHTLIPNEIGTFTSFYPLAEGDGLAIRYDYLVEGSADPNDPKGGVPGGRAESNAARANTGVEGNLFRMNDYPEWLPGAIPLCKVVRGRLYWCDNTVQATNTSVTPGLDSTALVYPGGGAWADGTTNPATTIVAQLTKIIADLAASTGAAKLGMTARPNWFDGTTNPALRLDQAVYNIISHLADSTGARKIGAEAQSSGSAAVTLGSVYTQTGQMLALLNGLRTDLDNRSLQAAYARSVVLAQTAPHITVGTSTFVVGSTGVPTLFTINGTTETVTVNSTLQVVGNAFVSLDLDVSDDLTVGDALGVAGNATFSGGVSAIRVTGAGAGGIPRALIQTNGVGGETILYGGAWTPSYVSDTGSNVDEGDFTAFAGHYQRVGACVFFSIEFSVDTTSWALSPTSQTLNVTLPIAGTISGDLIGTVQAVTAANVEEVLLFASGGTEMRFQFYITATNTTNFIKASGSYILA